MNGWGELVDWNTVCRRASGRRRYNAVRAFRRAIRRCEVAKLLHRMGLGHGMYAHIARRLGVSKSTITRDVQALMREANHDRRQP